jgi:hypothetical protein
MKNATVAAAMMLPRPPIAAAVATCGLRWLGSVLTALLLLQLGGVWMGQRGSERSVGGPVSLPSSTAAISAPNERHRRLNQSACRHAIVVPFKPTCPRQLVVKYLESAGFGHQFTELLFGMYAAQYMGLTLTWSPFAPSQDHGDDYTGLVKVLGLERFFVDGLGLMRADDLLELYRSKPTMFGQWIEVGNLDKRSVVPTACNNTVLSIEGWWHCRSGIADNNCFWAPEHAFLFQRFGECLRAGVHVYGTAFDRCVFKEEKGEGNNRYLRRDTLVVVWHLRFGDVSPRKPGDVFFANVVQALKQIIPIGLIKQVHIVLVGGGGKATSGVPQAYVDSLRDIIVNNNENASDTSLRFQVERFHKTSFEEQFLAMMQADVLVGSGSSVPQVATLLSGKPVFFNHVPKHGYGYGQEAMADAVDMDEQGRVLDSLRRVKVMLFNKLMMTARRKNGRLRR